MQKRIKLLVILLFLLLPPPLFGQGSCSKKALLSANLSNYYSLDKNIPKAAFTFVKDNSPLDIVGCLSVGFDHAVLQGGFQKQIQNIKIFGRLGAGIHKDDEEVSINARITLGFHKRKLKYNFYGQYETGGSYEDIFSFDFMRSYKRRHEYGLTFNNYGSGLLYTYHFKKETCIKISPLWDYDQSFWIMSGLSFKLGYLTPGFSRGLFYYKKTLEVIK